MSNETEPLQYRPIWPLRNGIYAPIPTAFTQDEKQELNLKAIEYHALRLARAKCGIVASGSTGEAVMLTREERFRVIQVIRQAFIREGIEDIPVIAGTGGQSTSETIEMCHDARKAGADAVIVITPGYFSSLLNSKPSLKQFYTQIADASALPVMIYNFPAASGGIDMDSDLLSDISLHPNIFGAKLTCANVGKTGRLANCEAARRKYGKAVQNGGISSPKFHVFPGYADIMFPCIMIGSNGAIAGTANVIPKACVEHFEDIERYLGSPSTEKLARIQRQQDLISRFESAMNRGGIQANKFILNRLYPAEYHQGEPRKPLLPITHEVASSIINDIEPILAYERQLGEQSKN